MASATRCYLGIFGRHLTDTQFFLMFAGLAAGAGGLLLACKKPLQKAFGSGV